MVDRYIEVRSSSLIHRAEKAKLTDHAERWIRDANGDSGLIECLKQS